MQLYNKNAFDCSKITANNYSTSFSLGIKMFKKKYRPGIYGIYGFVRFADEIVDTFHNHNQKDLLTNLREETFKAINDQFSTNPILHSFQYVVNEYNINHEYIEAFLDSMEMDLTHQKYNQEEISRYIYGSAEVVGLMCLRVFYKNRNEKFNELVHPARKLGEAFQKVNFLRDIRADYIEKKRIYFSGIEFENFSEAQKKEIENDIAADFEEALAGIKKLHSDVRLGVFLAYTYYIKLLEKIRKTTPDDILTQRYRISNSTKLILFANSWIKHKLGMI
jgi:phytoene/squalene synthetase